MGNPLSVWREIAGHRRSLKKRFSLYEIVHSYILMFKLTWITGKELKREIKKQRRPISLEEKRENFIAVVETEKC